MRPRGDCDCRFCVTYGHTYISQLAQSVLASWLRSSDGRAIEKAKNNMIYCGREGYKLAHVPECLQIHLNWSTFYMD